MPEILSNEHSEIDLLVWNVDAGGYNSYNPHIEGRPEREAQIFAAIDQARATGCNAASFTDAQNWDKCYGGEAGIATNLGFTSARFEHIADARLNAVDEAKPDAPNGAGIGIAFATNKHIQDSYALDLGSRQGLNVILDVGSDGLQIASVYLDDLSPADRRQQVTRLLLEINRKVPTMLVGDFNDLRPDMRAASRAAKVKNMAIKMMASNLGIKVLDKVDETHDLSASIAGMHKRSVVPIILEDGFRDADEAKKRPTAPTNFGGIASNHLPSFGIDYVFHDNRVAVSEPQIVADKKASDHARLRVSAKVA